MLRSGQKYLALTLFFFSGFSALIYEIVWARLLGLVFGTSLEAISAVITAFMFGLALGSYFAGRHSDYIRKHLSAYAITEILIGISSILLYFTITNFPFLLRSIHNDILAGHEQLFIVLVYILNFLLVAIPTTLMGATFPLVAKHFIVADSRVGAGVGVLYGVNTFGAVLGTFICGFYLIPTFGVMETNFLAAFISISLGILALLSDRGDKRKKIFNVRIFIEKSEINLSPLKDPLILAVLIAFAVSGFASMAYEIVWTRLLVLIIGNSTYAFSAILTIYLLGLALGSFLFARLADRSRNLLILFALLEFLIFLFVAITLPFVDNLPFLFQYLYNNFYSGFASLELIVFIVITVIILIPTILMGATFPVANKIITSRTTCLGYSVGSTYSANTIGGLFGAFAAGFYFIPSLGIEKSMLLISFLNILACIVLFFQLEKKKVLWKGSLATALITFFAFYMNWLPDWNRNYLNRGVYVYAGWFDENFEGVNVNLKTFFNEKYKLKLYREGKIGTVAVTDIDGQLALQVNGKTEGSTGLEDMRTQTMVAAIPLMLKGEAKDVAIIGMGTGVTLGVAEQFNVVSIDCIEISKDVVEASSLFYKWNHDALHSPKMNLIIGDGRNYLTYAEKNYDVIINEPSNPWISGVSNLFTLEFFELAKARLKKNGVMAQWIQLYSLETSELKVILGTFKTVFPYVSVWMFSPSDIVVVGSAEPNSRSYENIERAFYNRSLAQDLRALGINSVSDVMKGYLFGSEDAAIFVKNAPLNTDNYPVVEFEAPKALHRPSPLKNVQALQNCC